MGGRRGVDGGRDAGVDPNNAALISQLRDEVAYLRDENRRKDEIIMQQAMTMRQLTAAPSQEPPEAAETVKLDVLRSGYVHLGAGVNYTGKEGFVFMATTGAALRLASNTRYVSGDYELYKSDVRPLYRGGMIVSLAFGYAF